MVDGGTLAACAMAPAISPSGPAFTNIRKTDRSVSCDSAPSASTAESGGLNSFMVDAILPNSSNNSSSMRGQYKFRDVMNHIPLRKWQMECVRQKHKLGRER